MSSNYHSPKVSSGFTLIELMIVVTMIGIISSLAISAFTGYTSAADRADAQADLYELAQVMERAFTSERTYATIDMDPIIANFSASSSYTFSMSEQLADSYQIDAVATNDSRDNFDLALDNVGIEQFRVRGATTWSATTGWNNID